MRTAPEHVVLPGDEVHLWLLFLTDTDTCAVLARDEHVLPESERRKALRFVFERDQRRYLLTRLLVRTVLSRYSAIAPQEWSFVVNSHGKPAIGNVAEAGNRLSFNISHSQDLIVLGVAERRDLGVDVEHVHARTASVDIADRFFSAQEAACLRALPESERQERFFHYWTLKESYIKARGLGLSIPLHQFAFELPEDDHIGVRFEPELADTASSWQFWLTKPSCDYMLAVCAHRSDRSVRKLVIRNVSAWNRGEPDAVGMLRQSR